MNKHEDIAHISGALTLRHSQYGRCCKDIPFQNAFEMSWNFLEFSDVIVKYEYIQSFHEVRF
jgi:hypothetical protein